MSIMRCPRCSDSFDSDQHTEPLCKTCMGKVETSCSDSIYEPYPWIARFKGNQDFADGQTEDESILNLVRAI